MDFPYLSIIALSPILFAVIILMLPKERGENARMLGLAAMVLGLILSIYVYVATYQNLPAAGTPWGETLKFVEEHDWVPSLGLNYIVGVDGLSATLVLLTGAYILKGIGATLHGPLKPQWAGLPQMTLREHLVIWPLMVLMLSLGIWPQWLLAVINDTVTKLFSG